jgi:hypothetical protein
MAAGAFGFLILIQAFDGRRERGFIDGHPAIAISRDECGQ